VLKTIDKIERYLRPLLNFARDEIHAQEALGRLEPGQPRPEDIVDEALLDAMQSPAQLPPGRTYPWLRDLVRRVVEREVKHPQHRSLFEPVGDRESTAPRRLIDVLPNPSSPIPEQVVESLKFQHGLATILRQLPAAWLEPTPEQLARTRARLDTAA
jgi:DNA-directed RNA polymerase specialized sigma24 family protein